MLDLYLELQKDMMIQRGAQKVLQRVSSVHLQTIYSLNEKMGFVEAIEGTFMRVLKLWKIAWIEEIEDPHVDQSSYSR